ncbi:MAG: hypothetical protein QOH31_6869, partial [Verrucomicrobiota bacterium]
RGIIWSKKQLFRGQDTRPLVPFTAVSERGRVAAEENLSARNTGAPAAQTNLCHETLVRRVPAKRRIPGRRVGFRLCSNEQSCPALRPTEITACGERASCQISARQIPATMRFWSEGRRKR